MQFTKDQLTVVEAQVGQFMNVQGFGCSESVLFAFQSLLSPDFIPDSAISMATAFRGGQGTGCLCGGLAACQMVLGAFFGHKGGALNHPDDEALKKCKELALELSQAFRDANKSTCCRDLIEGYVKQSPDQRERCAALMASAVRLAGEIIIRENTAK